MGNCEILAPVGGQEQLLAAVRCGADAVYLGTTGFNARRNAENFDAQSLKAAISYCHVRGVKVYVTVNTLVMDSEFERLEDEARLIAESGADAVIIQDMAVMKLFRDRYPTLKRHASTQTVVHNTDGAKLLRDLGYDRVVLARELTLNEMETVISRSGVEAEAFVHGAHCMSVSGACYLSAMLGGRSGNRGLCAQPCRLDFRAGNRDHALSLKDMSYIGHIRKMSDIGVSSFKIEGRMKRPEYVAAAVTACREALEGKSYDAETLEAVFSRSGFTDGYLRGRRGPEMFGFRRKEDVEAASGVLGKLSSLYRAETPRIPVNMKLVLTANEPSSLTVYCETEEISVDGAVPEPARNVPTDRDIAYKSLSKTGGTPYTLDKLDFSGDGLVLPVSELNALRRSVLDTLSALRGETKPHEFCGKAEKDIFADYKAPERCELWGRFECAEQIPDTDALSRVILPIREIYEHRTLIDRFVGKLVGELPAVVFPEYEDEVREMSAQLKDAGLRAVLTENIYGIRLGNELGFEMLGGAGRNVMNTSAGNVYEELGLSAQTLSFELSMSAIKRMKGSFRRGFIAYGYLPLMRLRACPGKLAGGCGSCGGHMELKDRKAVAFTLLCSEKKYSTLLNSIPLHIADKELAPVDFMTLYFTVEDRENCARVIDDYLKHRPSEQPRTGGLYFRGVL